MGMTIHYSGRAKNWDALTRLISAAQMFACEREWMMATLDDPFGHMDDRDKDDPGLVETDDPIRMMVINPGGKCESIRLRFTANCELLPAWTKTQFAPFSVHKEVVALLRAIEPFMAEFNVMDETGYWETGDEAAARAKFDGLGRVIGMMAEGLAEKGLDVETPYVAPEKEPFG